MLKQRDNTLKYVNIFEGKFYLSEDKDRKNPYDELEGVVTNLEFKDETYNGAESRKLYISVSDGTQTLKFGIISDSVQGTSLINFLANVDLSKPVTFTPKYEVKNVDGVERKNRMVFVSQEGKAVKYKFQREDLPEVKKVIINKKTVSDKTELIEFFEKVVNEKLIPQLGSASPVVKVDKEELPWESDEQADLDLPF